MDRKVSTTSGSLVCGLLALGLALMLGPATAKEYDKASPKLYVAAAPLMTVEWTWNVSDHPALAAKNLNDVTLGAVVADDIDKDGAVEILFTFRKAEDRVICLSSKTKDLKWVYPPIDQDPFKGGDPWGIASIEDIDNDGSKEILIHARDANLHCITPNGQVKWMYECGGTETPPALYDVNNDGKLEIVDGPLSGAKPAVLLLDGSGKKIWDFPVTTHANTGSTAFDIDKDGKVEILTADGSGNVFCISSGGAEKWRFEMGSSPCEFKPVIADVNGDGECEILVHSENRYLYCLNFFGTELWRFPIGRIAINATITYWDLSEDAGIGEGNIAVADVDADGGLEILAGDWIGNFHCINGTGAEEWYTHFPSEMWTGVTVGDVNGDGRVDVVSGSDGDEDPEIYSFFGLTAPSYPQGVIAAVDGADGTTVGAYPMAVSSCQGMGDWDGDGNLEIAVYLDTFYVLTMNGKYDAKLVPWPFRFKDLHSNPVVLVPESVLYAAAVIFFALAPGFRRRGM